jgi:hypothetical protein
MAMNAEMMRKLLAKFGSSERSIRELTSRLEDLIGTVPGIVWEADAVTLSFLYVSRQPDSMLGYPALSARLGCWHPPNTSPDWQK